jgi:hypothetical protein
LYRCPYSCNSSNCSSYVADDNSTICPLCNNKMDRIVTLIIDPPRAIRASPNSEEGYVKLMVTYMVMDDIYVGS